MSSYGLAATQYCNDVSRAHHYARKLKAGTVGVNNYSEREISTPFGGHKAWYRDEVAGLMTTEDISKARSMARECMSSGYTKCGY